MKFVSMTALTVLAVLLGGCNEQRPTVSLDQARQITANFSKQGFVAPPRSVNDILALLDQEKPDPVKALANVREADAQPPGKASDGDLASFYQDRGLAAARLGRTRQQIDDLTKAVDYAHKAPESVDYSRLLQQLSLAHLRAGNRVEGVRYRKLQQAEHEGANSQRGRLFGVYASMVTILADEGDIDGAKKYLEKISDLLAQSMSWNKGNAYAANGQVWEATYMTGSAMVAEKTGQLAKAEDLRRREVAAYETVSAAAAEREDAERLANNRDQALRALSHVLAEQNRVVEAEIAARQALLNRLRALGRYAPETAEALMALTDVVAQQGRYADAEKLARATIDIYEHTGHGAESWSLAQARAILGMVQMLSDQQEQALATFQALDSDIAADRALHKRMLGGNLYYADALLNGERTVDAANIYRRAAEFRGATLGPTHPDTAEAQGMLAVALVESGDNATAMQSFAQAVPPLLSNAAQAEGDDFGEGSVGRERRRRRVLEAYIGLLAEAGSADSMAESFRIADTAHSQIVQKSLSASATRSAAQDAGMAELVRNEQDADQQLAAQQSVLADQLAAPPGQRDEAALAAARTQVETLHAARQALRGEITKRFPAYAKLRNPPPVTQAQAQAALHDGEALIAILVGSKRSFVWAIPQHGEPAFAAVPMGRREVARMVAKLRAPMEAQISSLGKLPAYDLAEAYRAYNAFLAPVEAGWKGSRSLMVVADRALGQLPFSILVTEPTRLEPEQRGDALLSNYRKAPWLVRQAAVTQLPSVASLVALRQLPPGPASRKPFIGFGDPWFTAAQAAEGQQDLALRGLGKTTIATRGFHRRAVPATGGLDSAQLKSLPRLPETADEIIAVAQALHADETKDVFLGLQANEKSILAMPMADRKVVMFATHGLVPGDIDGLTQPALAMSHPDVTQAGGTGLLTMDNVLGLKLDADWVVLSACNTASGEGAGAEAISGLGRAFFYAGTRAVLATHWAVESGSAAAITSGLFKSSAEHPDIARAEALRQTMLSLIDGPGAIDPDSKQVMYSYAHPIFWAPYALVGDGG